MTDRELMQMALNALEECYDVQAYPANGETIQDDAIKALLARLAQPEPYPENFIDALRFDAAQSEPTIDGWPLYSGLPPFSPSGGSKENESQKIFRTIQQREWVGLTDEEIAEIGKIWLAGNRMLPFPLAKAIEAKLKEKNGV